MYYGLLFLMVVGVAFGVGQTVAVIFLLFCLLSTLLLFGAISALESDVNFAKALAVGCMSVLLTLMLIVIGIFLYAVALEVDFSFSDMGEFASNLGGWVYLPVLIWWASIVYWSIHYVDTTFWRAIGIATLAYVLYVVMALIFAFIVAFVFPHKDVNDAWLWIKDAIASEYVEKYGEPEVVAPSQPPPQQNIDPLQQWREQQRSGARR